MIVISLSGIKLPRQHNYKLNTMFKKNYNKSHKSMELMALTHMRNATLTCVLFSSHGTAELIGTGRFMCWSFFIVCTLTTTECHCLLHKLHNCTGSTLAVDLQYVSNTTSTHQFPVQI